MGKVAHLLTATREVLDTRDLSTGLLKRAAFERAVDAWVGGGDARRPATSLLMVQLGVKGAPIADRTDRQLLVALSKSVTGLLRATDIVGHVDEDTIGVLLPSTPAVHGERVAGRILETFRESRVAQKHALAATIGVASANTTEPWLSALQALRQARLSGGDCVVVAPERPDPAELVDEPDPVASEAGAARGNAAA